MAGTKRTDNKGRVLRKGESQIKSGASKGKYIYKYTDEAGNSRYEYSWKLLPTDKPPLGKKDELSLREKEEAILIDRSNGINREAKKNKTVNDIWDTYIKNKSGLKQSTRTNYVYLYDNYVKPRFGTRKIASVKFSDILEFYNYLLDEAGFKPKSMENIHCFLHPMFELAVRDDIILKNPTDGVIAELKKTHNWEAGKRHALTEEQQSAFIDYVSGSPKYKKWLPMFTVFLGTGCRVAELTGLRWQDIDLRTGEISINHNLIYRMQDSGKNELHITTPKTEAGNRTIPMLSAVKKAFLILLQEQMKYGCKTESIIGDNGKEYTGFIFVNEWRGVIRPQLINRAINNICRDYNEEEIAKAISENRAPLLLPHFSVHHFRHTFCTRFCENETNLKIIQEIMGHADIATTMNIYNEATADRKKKSFENLDEKIKIE